jgi:hypothetical protein
VMLFIGFLRKKGTCSLQRICMRRRGRMMTQILQISHSSTRTPKLCHHLLVLVSRYSAAHHNHFCALLIVIVLAASWRHHGCYRRCVEAGTKVKEGSKCFFVSKKKRRGYRLKKLRSILNVSTNRVNGHTGLCNWTRNSMLRVMQFWLTVKPTNKGKERKERFGYFLLHKDGLAWGHIMSCHTLCMGSWRWS